MNPNPNSLAGNPDTQPLQVPKDEIALMEEGLQKGQMATDQHAKMVGGMTQGQKEDLKEFAQSTEMKDESAVKP